MKRGTDLLVKFLKLKRALGVPKWQVKGILQSIWDFASENAFRGDIGRFSNEDIALGMEYEGDIENLISVLIETHWVDEHPQHRIVIHDWRDHCEEWILKRIVRDDAKQKSQKIDTRGGRRRGTADNGELVADNGGQRRTTSAVPYQEEAKQFTKITADNGGQRPPTADNGGPWSAVVRDPEPILSLKPDTNTEPFFSVHAKNYMSPGGLGSGERGAIRETADELSVSLDCLPCHHPDLMPAVQRILAHYKSSVGSTHTKSRVATENLIGCLLRDSTEEQLCCCADLYAKQCRKTEAKYRKSPASFFEQHGAYEEFLEQATLDYTTMAPEEIWNRTKAMEPEERKAIFDQLPTDKLTKVREVRSKAN